MPAIALLTDFGTDDHYVGTMKGVMLGIAPGATLVDITHAVAPQDILGGALQLAAAYRYFAQGTVFLAVVDPGVGSERRAIAVCAAGRTFVAPDNGLLSAVLAESPADTIVELRNPQFALRTISRTFEGRDRFAPAAAWIASGVPPSSLGPARDDYVRLPIPQPAVGPDTVTGEVLHTDRFGNLITNIDRRVLEPLLAAGPCWIGAGVTGPLRLATTYAEMPGDEICAIFGSSDRLEISVRGGSAAARLSASRGLPVVVRRDRVLK